MFWGGIGVGSFEVIFRIMPTCNFTKIAVLQSLGKKDLKTGKKLFEDIDTAESFFQRGIEIKFYELDGKQEPSRVHSMHQNHANLCLC